MLKLLQACSEELVKFNSECSSFETWLAGAEEKVKALRGKIRKPETLEQREAAHEVMILLLSSFHYNDCSDDYKNVSSVIINCMLCVGLLIFCL